MRFTILSNTNNPKITRNVLFLLFALPGMSFASWVSRTPAIRDLLQVSTSEMGIIIFAMASGSLVGLLTAASFIARKGARLAILAGSLLITFGFVALGFGVALTSVPFVMGSLIIFGCGYGLAEVALSVEGSVLEKALNKTLLPAFHGFFSVGTLVGAALGAFAEAVHLQIAVHFTILSLIMLLAVVYGQRYLPESSGKEVTNKEMPKHSGIKQQLKVWSEKRTMFIGIIVLGMAFAEGAANDWLPLSIVDGYGVNSTTGSFVYGLFVAAMTIGRFAGGRILDRYGRVRVLLSCAVSATLGLVLVIWGQHYIVASLGAILWGLGTSLGFPVGLSAAGDDPKGAVARVGAVATTGYIASLVGPPMLGFLGEHFGLLNALIFVLVGTVVSGFLSKAAKPL